MKKLILALFITATASAGLFPSPKPMPTVDSSWETIRADFGRVDFDSPSVRIDGGPMTSAFGVCKEGDFLKTTFKLTKCVQWERSRGRDHDRVCVEEVKYTGYAAIEGTRERCTEWQRAGRNGDRVCISFEDYNYVLPLSFDVNVYRAKRRNRGSDRFGRKLFTKTLSITDCK